MRRASLLAAEDFPQLADQAYRLVRAFRLQFQALQFDSGAWRRGYLRQRNSPLRACCDRNAARARNPEAAVETPALEYHPLALELLNFFCAQSYHTAEYFIAMLAENRRGGAQLARRAAQPMLQAFIRRR